MADPRSLPLFKCPSCGAVYQVVKAEAGPETVDHKITCRVCKGSLAPREGQHVLKYFPLRKGGRLDARQARQVRAKRKAAEAAPDTPRAA
jgi:predicted Zn finger-like uncharacterized protein